MKCALLTLILLGGCLLTACVRSADPPPTDVRIECRKEGGEYRYFLNGDPSPSSVDAMEASLRDYAGLVDRRAGMPGRDAATSHSRNPLVFSMSHDAPWTHVLDVVEVAAFQRFISMQVEVARPDRSVESCELGWPVDESFAPPREGMLELRVIERGGRISYEAALEMFDAEDASVSTTLGAGKHESDWRARPGRPEMKKMAGELKEVLGQHVDVVNDAVILAQAGLPWGEMHFAICVVDELKTLLDRRSEGYFCLQLIDLRNPQSRRAAPRNNE